MIEQQKLKIQEHYAEMLKKHGASNAASLNYSCFENQVLRFIALCQIANLNKASILDLGCGYGDLSYYLNKKFKDIQYLGVDISPDILEVAQKKYPSHSFTLGTIQECNGPFDFILASGLFGISIGSVQENWFHLEQTLIAMCEKATKGIAVNFLNAENHPSEDGMYCSYYKADIIALCSQKGFDFEIVDGYLEHDFSLYVYF